MPEVQTPTSFDSFNSIISSVPPDVLIALSFHTPWAAPCKQMNQVFSTLASADTNSNNNNNTIYVSINAEDLPDVSEKYEVAAVPYFVLIKNGEVVGKVSGADPKELRDAIEKAKSGSNNNSAGGVPSLPPAQATTSTTTHQQPSTNGTTNDDIEEPVEEESLNDRLIKLVAAAPVMLFMKGTPASPECGFSRQLVGMLRERGIRYGFFNILKDDDVRQGLKKFSEWPTYPQLYHKGELVGGLDIVKEEFESNPDFLKDQSINA